MPFASEEQRRWMFATHPVMARRWASEEKKAPVLDPLAPFAGLLASGLVGVSDRVLRDHLTLYERAARELGALQASRPRGSGPSLDVPGMTAPEVRALLEMRVGDLPLEIEGRLAVVIDELRQELQMRGISWFPDFYLGDGDFWTTDRGVSINVPWYFANDVLWALVNDHLYRYSEADVMRTLRHEAGHALGYAFELWRRPEWTRAFGDFLAPYEDVYSVDAASGDFVDYLAGTGSAAIDHYGQKHPDEDWAETFAEWLDPGSRWQEAYADRPGALAKLEAVELMIVGRGAAYGPAPNAHRGRRVPYRTLDYTVGAFLGEAAPDGIDEADAARRREPALLASVELHRLYFEQLARGAGASVGIGPRLGMAISASWGSTEAWLRDLREVARATDGWALAAWDARAGVVRNVLVEGHDRGNPPGMPILLAVDCWEHAYAPDYGIRKDLGVAAFFRNLDWTRVERRFDLANPPPPIVVPVLGPIVDDPMYAPEPVTAPVNTNLV
jgi:hypothetical protein